MMFAWYDNRDESWAKRLEKLCSALPVSEMDTEFRHLPAKISTSGHVNTRKRSMSETYPSEVGMTSQRHSSQSTSGRLDLSTTFSIRPTEL